MKNTGIILETIRRIKAKKCGQKILDLISHQIFLLLAKVNLTKFKRDFSKDNEHKKMRVSLF